VELCCQSGKPVDDLAPSPADPRRRCYHRATTTPPLARRAARTPVVRIRIHRLGAMDRFPVVAGPNHW